MAAGTATGVRPGFEFRDGRLHCEDVPVDELVRRFGTPLYVYSQSVLHDRYDEVARAFAPVDPLIAYSVKANGNLSLLRLLAAWGAGADIVSRGELHRARLAGIPGDRIVFSGVGKTVEELAAGIEAGLYGFNVESEGELRSLSELAAATGVLAPAALRVNPDIEASTPHQYIRTGHAASKFGVPYADARGLYRLGAALPGLRMAGVDLHIGSQIIDAKPYREAVDRAAELIGGLRADGIELEYLDIGGGFGITYDQAEAPSASDFAVELVPALQAIGLRIVLEPGRFVVGPAGVLLARVLYIKKTATKTFVITDAGMNDLLRPSHYASYHRVEPAERHAGRDIATVDVVGPICETGDFLALGREIERVEPGEVLVVGETGAYGFVMASTYNARPRPAEVLVAGGEYRLIRRREGLDDLVRGEVEYLDAARDT